MYWPADSLMWFDVLGDKITAVMETSRDEQSEPQHPVVCAQCSHPVSEKKYAIEIGSSHQHVKTNPQGQTFSIVCYTEAPGCKLTGEPQSEYSWFPGCRWQFAHCGQCHNQMGWYFSGASHFFAFITDNIIIH